MVVPMQLFIVFFRRHLWVIVSVVIALSVSLLIKNEARTISAIWPTLVALVIVFLSKNAILGLSTGAIAGSLILADGRLFDAFELLLSDLFLPIFQSPWKLSAILFTLILGGFVALLEKGGGLHGLLSKLLGSGPRSRNKTQLVVSGFGLLVFFDGLANSMLVGRLMRSAVDQSRVSRVKLAYLADTTSSAVACIAFVSTWIAFQLSMIREGYLIAGQEVDAYRLFFASIPANFYCWFSLFLIMVCILRDFNPGPMGAHEARVRTEPPRPVANVPKGGAMEKNWLFAIVPIAVLVLSVPTVSYIIGSDSFFPLSFSKFAEAYGAAEQYVPQIMVASALLAALVGAITYMWSRLSSKDAMDHESPSVVSVFFSGIRDLSQPVLILVAAWMLGGTISQLGAADMISTLLEGNLPSELFPALVFLSGALISFSTGTSWGTMAVLMPLAIPVALTITGDTSAVGSETLVVHSIAAVFSGAVFGDHCSPFSDTTIVSSIAAGVDPLDHVKTQMPFALIASLLAVCVGFIPLGYGVSPLILLPVGLVLLFALPSMPELRTQE